MQAEVLTKALNELRTIEIDVQKQIFRVNGEDFGKCMEFTLSCTKPRDVEKDWFDVGLRMSVGDVVFKSNYDIMGRKREKAG